LHQAEEWLGLQTIVIVERTRHLWNKTTTRFSSTFSSLPSESPRIAAAIRQHRGIENLALDARCHLGEDDCRCALCTPSYLALLRRFAVNTLNRESTFKRSLKQKSKRAAMDDAYMLTLLSAHYPIPSGDATCPCLRRAYPDSFAI